jgi:hypothetical protein
VLRDYRFYDIDLAHPNYAATQFVMEHFTDYAFDHPTKTLLTEIRQLVTARKHKPFHPGSSQHRDFLNRNLLKAEALSKLYPSLDFSSEITYFNA